MVYIKQDTLRMKECGKQIKDATTKYNEEIGKFFSKASMIGDYWIGEDADNFVFGIKQEKKTYTDFANLLNAYSDSLTEMSLQIEKMLNTCKMK